MILTIGLNNAYQKVLLFDAFHEGGVLRASHFYTAPSGKGINTARALKTMGSKVTATGFIGGSNGKLILNELRKEKVLSDFVFTKANTRVCTTLLNKKTDSFTELIEPSGKISQKEVAALKVKLSKLFKKAGLITISGTLPPGVRDDFYFWIIKKAAETGTRVLCDICNAPLRKAVKAKPYLIKMNREEFKATFGKQKPEKKIQELLNIGISWVIVTNGKKKFLAGAEGKLFQVIPPAVKTVNGVGSGDAMLAGLAYGINKGFSPEDTLKLASAAGAASAMTIRPAEFEFATVLKLAKKVSIKLPK